jgi:ABC-type multidrug transport system ATPase subunit/ABC-type multidrug transport system permease subunit
LNVIADRYDKNSFRIGGKINLNTFSSRDVGYVTQQDYLLPCLTVQETILFTARLRVSPTDVRIQRAAAGGDGDGYERIVRDVMMDLGLRECAHTQIGDDIQAFGTRGISGGEKRRVSIACQIITDPAILCADEPTSGLDSFTAITVMESLKRLCSPSFHHQDSSSPASTNTTVAMKTEVLISPPHPQTRCPTTVICSIHQPRADVFHLFDSILLLSKGGHAVYCGPTEDMFEYFGRLSYVCPSDSNPADYFVDISSIDPALSSPKEIQNELQKLQILIDTFHQTNNTSSPSSDEENPDEFTVKATGGGAMEGASGAYNSSWPIQIYYLTYRFFLNNFRSKGNVLGSFLQSLSLSLIIMGIFWNLGDSLEDIESRNGLMYLVSSMENYILLIIFVERYCTELKVFDREIQDHMYATPCYLIAHHISTLPMILIQSVLYALPIYYGCHLREGSFHVFIFLFDIIVMSLVTNALAIVCVTIHRNFTIASLISNTNFTFITIAAGFLVSTKDTPIYLRWIKHLSYVSYSYRILMANEFTDRVFDCPYTSPGNNATTLATATNNDATIATATDTGCSQYNGNAILDSQAVDQNEERSITWFYLILLLIIYYLIGFILLEYHRFPVTGTVGIQTEEEEVEQEQEEKLLDPSTPHSPSSFSSSLVTTGEETMSSFHSESPQNELLLKYEYPPCQSISISIRNISLDVQVSKTRIVPVTAATPIEAAGLIVNPMIPSSSTPGQEPVPASVPGQGQGFGSEKKKRKVILDNISGEILPGRLVALMGGSGSGKVASLSPSLPSSLSPSLTSPVDNFIECDRREDRQECLQQDCT